MPTWREWPRRSRSSAPASDESVLEMRTDRMADARLCRKRKTVAWANLTGAPYRESEATAPSDIAPATRAAARSRAGPYGRGSRGGARGGHPSRALRVMSGAAAPAVSGAMSGDSPLTTPSVVCCEWSVSPACIPILRLCQRCWHNRRGASSGSSWPWKTPTSDGSMRRLRLGSTLRQVKGENRAAGVQLDLRAQKPTPSGLHETSRGDRLQRRVPSRLILA
jgi:hypothetical protein